MTAWRELIDIRSGLVGGSLLAGVVWLINASHGAAPATTAAAKQFAYTFCMGGLVMRLCTRLALRPGDDRAVLLVAIGLPSLLTIGATLLLHSLRGTPEPLLSTLPATLVAPPSFAVWAWKTHADGHSPWEDGPDRHSGPGR